MHKHVNLCTQWQLMNKEIMNLKERGSGTRDYAEGVKERRVLYHNLQNKNKNHGHYILCSSFL